MAQPLQPVPSENLATANKVADRWLDAYWTDKATTLDEPDHDAMIAAARDFFKHDDEAFGAFERYIWNDVFVQFIDQRNRRMLNQFRTRKVGLPRPQANFMENHYGGQPTVSQKLADMQTRHQKAAKALPNFQMFVDLASDTQKFLLEWTAADCLRAARRRQARGVGELGYAAFYLALAQALLPGKTVGECFDMARLEELYLSAKPVDGLTHIPDPPAHLTP